MCVWYVDIVLHIRFINVEAVGDNPELSLSVWELLPSGKKVLLFLDILNQNLQLEFCVDADEYSLEIGFEQCRTELAE